MRLSLGGRFIAVGVVIVLVWTLVVWAIA